MAGKKFNVAIRNLFIEKQTNYVPSAMITTFPSVKSCQSQKCQCLYYNVVAFFNLHV